MMLPGPNASLYETYVFHDFILNFYLQQGFSVFLFNYSGFGASTGSTTTTRIRQDGEACVEYLKSRFNARNIAVHGRSMGGYVACHLACKYPENISLLVADRTFASLGATAASIYGNWSTHALNFCLARAESLDNFLAAQCYKVMVCDPKDQTISDLTSLRSSVACKVVREASWDQRLEFSDDQVQAILQAWNTLSNLAEVLNIVEGTEDSDEEANLQVSSGAASGEEVLQPLMMDPYKPHKQAMELQLSDVAAVDFRGSNEEDTEERDVEMGKMPPVSEAQVARLAFEILDIAGKTINAGGRSLRGALSADFPQQDPLRVFLANLQVWGSRTKGDLQVVTSRREVTAFTNESDCVEDLHDYCLEQAGESVAQCFKEVSERANQLHRLLDQGSHPARLRGVADHVRTLEVFLSAVNDFFKKPRKKYCSTRTGYLVHCTCGHNGDLSERETKQLFLHVQRSQKQGIRSKTIVEAPRKKAKGVAAEVTNEELESMVAGGAPVA